MSACDTTVPDLLRRFVPTPHSLRVALGKLGLEMQTNDAEIARALLLAPSQVAPSEPPLLVKVVRDNEVSDNGADIVLLRGWPVTTMFVGMGTVLAIDGERREILGFVSSSISPQRFVDDLLPLALELYREASKGGDQGREVISS